MPKQFLATSVDVYPWYTKMHDELEFRLATRDERISWIRYKEILEKEWGITLKNNIKKGLEDCLVYEKGDREVHIWTSFVPENGIMRKSDFVWAYILDKRYPERPSLFTIPIRRTENCLDRTYLRAKALKNLVDNWQSCHKHVIDLKIILVKGKEMHRSSYVCPVGGYHPGIPRWIYTGMDEADRKVLEKSFEGYQKYFDKQKEKGHTPIPQRTLRAYGTNRKGYLNLKKQKGIHNETDTYCDSDIKDFYPDGDHLL